MKNRLALIVLGTFVPSLSFADCGSIPDAPELLEQAQLTTQQVEALSSEMDSYAESITTYRKCIEDEVIALAPSDATEEFFDSPSYQSDFENLVNLSDLAEQALTFSEERYNYLLENASAE